MPTTIDKNISRIELSRKEGSISDEVQITLMTLGGNYTVNQQVQYTLANQTRAGYIVGISKRLGTEGKYEQVLSILSLNSLDTLKSPKKTQKYITMSAQELYEFNRDYPKGSNYLDFNFKRKQGDNYGVGGWTCHQIITELASKIGYSVIIGTPNYYVKEFSVSSSTSYFSAILSLLSVYQPIIYLVDGILVIVDGGVYQKNIVDSRTAYAPQNVISVDESVVKHDKVSQFRVEGQMGKFDVNNIKEYIVPVDTRKKDIYGNLIGTQTGWGVYSYPLTVQSGSSWTTYTFSWECYGLEVSATVNSFFTATSFGTYINSLLVKALDIFGKPVATLLFYQEDRNNLGNRKIEINVNFYENMKAEFENSRPISYPFSFQTTYSYESGFKVIGSSIVYNNNLTLVSTKSSYVVYNEWGEIAQQWVQDYNKSWMEDVTGEGKPKYTPFYSLEGEYPDEANEAKDTGSPVLISGNGIKNVKVEDIITRNIRTSPYTFGTVTTRELMKIKNDESIWEKRTDSSVQEGHLPASPIRYRLGPIYKEYNGSANPNKNINQAQADNTITIDTPSITASAPSSNQSDINKMFDTVWYRLNKDEVVRNYVMYGEVDLYPGLKIDMRTLSNLDNSEQLKTPVLDGNFSPYISEYHLTKDFITGVSTTNITVKGKI